MPFIETLDRGLIALLRAAVALAVIVIFVLLLLGVVVRATPLFSMAGYDEIVELLVAWTVFLGAVVLWREGAHFRVEFLQRSLAPRAAWVVEGVAYALALAFALVFSYQSYLFAAGTAEMTAFFAMSKTVWYASMPVAGALMVVAALADLWRWARR
jgi:TRAP-type C4-dicarboxylate transport system permease small subunit